MEGTVEVQISTTRDRWCWNKIIGWSKCSSGWDFEIAAMFVLKGWMTSPLIQFVILLSCSKCLRFRQEIMWFFFNSYVISSGYHFKSSFFHIKALWKTCLYKGMTEKKLSVLLFSIRPTVGALSRCALITFSFISLSNRLQLLHRVPFLFLFWLCDCSFFLLYTMEFSYFYDRDEIKWKLAFCLFIVPLCSLHNE